MTAFDPLLEQDYQAALQRLRKPKRFGQGLLLIGSLALFLLVQRSQSTQTLIILVSVLLFHELGHYAGMRGFGYRDVKMFFIPFFGAAVSGRRGDVAAWKEGVVLLLGPIPGIVVGFVLGLRTEALSPQLREVALTMVGINLFNLLPIAGLDGARLLQLVLFSRRRWLETGFQACAGLAAGALALSWRSWLLGVIAYFMIMVLPYRWRLLGAARRVVEARVPLLSDVAALEDETTRKIFLEARTALAPQAQKRPATLAAAMQQLLDAALAKRPSAEESILIGAALLIGLVIGVAAIVFLQTAAPPAPGL